MPFPKLTWLIAAVFGPQQQEEVRALPRSERTRLGKDYTPGAPEEKAVEQPLEAGQSYWLYINPVSRKISLVQNRELDVGPEISKDQMNQVLACGDCVAAYSQIDTSEYWRAPSRESMIRLLLNMHIRVSNPEVIDVSHALVKSDQPKGHWFLVAITEPKPANPE